MSKKKILPNVMIAKVAGDYKPWSVAGTATLIRLSRMSVMERLQKGAKDSPKPQAPHPPSYMRPLAKVWEQPDRQGYHGSKSHAQGALSLDTDGNGQAAWYY